MTANGIRIIPAPPKTEAALRGRLDVSKKPGEIPEVGDKHGDGEPDLTTIFVGNCSRFDLSDESDRAEYAELSAKLLKGTEYQRLWEERNTTPNGELVVYVSYIRCTNIYDNNQNLI